MTEYRGISGTGEFFAPGIRLRSFQKIEPQVHARELARGVMGTLRLNLDSGCPPDEQ